MSNRIGGFPAGGSAMRSRYVAVPWIDCAVAGWATATRSPAVAISWPMSLGARPQRGDRAARSLGDNGSRDLLEDILEAEEKHANWIEAQLTLIAQTGEGNYLAQQIKNEDA